MKKLPSDNVSFWELDCTFQKVRRREKSLKHFHTRRRIKKKQLKLLNHHYDLFAMLMQRAGL